MHTMDYLSILPEIFLLISTCLLLLWAGFKKNGGDHFAYRLTLLTLLSMAIWFIIQIDDTSQLAFNEMFIYEPLTNLLKACSAIAFFVTLVYAKAYLQARNLFRVDLFALILLSLFGQCVMISSGHLLTIYLGLELSALASYAMIALQRDSSITSEAAIKYFILSALASGFLLYGLSMLYGATGSLNVNEILEVINAGRGDRLILTFATVFLIAGLAFKLGVVPFHMWVPDVYHGAPTAITLILAGAPKLAGLAIVLRLLVGGMLPLAFDWQQMLLVLSVLSLVIGNVTAIAQDNIKRMLAYSTIAHMGFILLAVASGVVAFQTHGVVYAYSAALFYILTYVLTTLGSFGIVLLLSRPGFEADQISDLQGLNKRHPWFAFIMLLLMFSLAGIPPTVGFYAKVLVLQAVVDADMVWLAVLAILTSLIGAFYYLRIVKTIYFDAPKDDLPLDVGLGFKSILSLNGILVLVFGLLPAGLMAMCARVVYQFLIY